MGFLFVSLYLYVFQVLFDSLFHPIQFCWFYFYLIVSGQQRPNPAHLPFDIILSKTAFLGASGTGCIAL